MNAARGLVHHAVTGLRRDWRAGELRLILVAVIIAVGAVTAVDFFTDRVRRAIESEAGALLGGDLALDAAVPIADAYAARASALGLATSRSLAMRSVLAAGDRLQMAELKAVDRAYPLRGQLLVAPAPFAAAAEAAGGPAPGTLWVEARLLTTLGVGLGDEIGVGASRLRVGAVLVLEPDRGGDLFSIAPRALMNLADLPDTKLVVPGSRVSHRLAVAGAAAAVAEYRAWAQRERLPEMRVRGVRDARPELTVALRRAEQFLGLAALIAVVVAGIGMATASARYAVRHYDACAILRCLGATQAHVVAVQAFALVAVAVTGAIAGGALGWFAQQGLAFLAASLTRVPLPPASLQPLAVGALTALIAVTGFALPPILRLREVPPARVLRRDLEPPRAGSIAWYGGAGALLLLLAPWRLDQPQVAGYVLLAAAGTALVLALAAGALVRVLGGLRGGVGVAWRFGLANIARRPGTSVLQIVALGLGITVLLLLGIVRADLLEGWRASLPPGAPDHFLVNVQPDEVEPIAARIVNAGRGRPPLYPMVRARLMQVNGRAVSVEDYTDPVARRRVDREFNLSQSRDLPDDNRVIAGRWWLPGARDTRQLSVEQDFAASLGWKLGDELTFAVAGESVSARITSLRTVEWDSFNVNFFVLGPPGLLDGLPATWITAFHLGGSGPELLVDLVRDFPSVTVIDVAALMGQVRSIMDQVTRAVEFVFAFTVAAGLVVLYAALAATHDQRVRETAVLRALGARDRTVRAGLLAELAALGLVCGSVATFAAAAAGWLLATQVFDIPWRIDALLLPAGIGGGLVGVTLGGWLGVQGVLATPAIELLRRP